MVKKETAPEDEPVEQKNVRRPLSAEELLEAAAVRLETQTGPRTNKHYRRLADQVRALMARI